MTAATKPEEMLEFWREAGPTKWFAKDDGFDAACVRRFRALWEEGTAGRLRAWEDAAQSALALVLLLDQMPRNMFRGTARVYASDPQARGVALRAVAKGHDRAAEKDLRPFFYLPFSHSEDMADQERALALYAALDDAEQMKWARHHHGIVARFGRFPHRNVILGRSSTAEEVAWLAEEGSFKG
ncbi:MAG: DUF924 family protein [Rhodospirillales bacterium]|nr:DUF924 family protein [Rhodospirillales bacterium]